MEEFKPGVELEPEEPIPLRDVEVMQQKIVDSFKKFFKDEKGFTEVEPEKMVPENDNSLLFTNSTTVPFKKYISNENIPPKGLLTEQPCLRTQNLKEMSEGELSYMSYFKMVGLFINTKEANEAAGVVWEYLKNSLGLEKEEVKLLISSADIQLQAWREIENGPIVEINSRPEKFYKWGYGMENIHGYGVTFSIRNKDGSFGDIGNLIAIRKDGRVIGYEFGFGVETLLARTHSLKTPFDASRISEIIGPDQIPDAIGLNKVRDCVAVLGLLYKLDIEPGSKGRNTITKKYMKFLIDLKNKHSLSYEKIKIWIDSFTEKEFKSSGNLGEMVIEDMEDYEKRSTNNQKEFASYVERTRLEKVEHSIEEVRDLISRLVKKGRKIYGLSEEDAERIVRKYFDSD